MFHPQMESRVSGVTILTDLRWRAWPGLIADVWDVACETRAQGKYVSRAPRLFMLLESNPATSMDLMCASDAQPCATLGPEHPMCFVPAGMPLWSRLNGGGRVRHLDIHFDIASLSRRFPGMVRDGRWDRPRLMFADPRLMALARLFALECCEKNEAGPVYDESLVTALLAAMGTGDVQPAGEGGLTAHQLRRVTGYIEQNCARNIRLRELAELVGLSPSHFSHLFKAATGLPPHRWQLRKRVEHVKAMLAAGETSLTEAAVAAGFSDQAHLTRVFQRFTGATPAAWQRRLGARHRAASQAFRSKERKNVQSSTSNLS